MKVVLLSGLVGFKCLVYLVSENLLFAIDNLVPYDGRPTTVIDTVALSLVMIILLLAVIGTVFAVICLAFNVACRNTRLFIIINNIVIIEFIYKHNRIVQISRPRLNYIIILGAILFYLTMILLAIPTSNQSAFVGLLKTVPWTMALGFSLCYGTIIMKCYVSITLLTIHYLTR